MLTANSNKATMRDFLNAVVKREIDDEVVAFAQSQLDKLDERNAKRAATPSKTAVANAPIKEAILEVLRRHNATAADIAALVSVTTQKASALCVQMVKEGVLVAEEVKVPKKGKVKMYSIAE